jgi:hypothetical protein
MTLGRCNLSGVALHFRQSEMTLRSPQQGQGVPMRVYVQVTTMWIVKGPQQAAEWLPTLVGHHGRVGAAAASMHCRFSVGLEVAHSL